ncbi:SGNH/GDSL hydrolase family protein [Planctomicrobium sp. SH661]|uniref:SGNH/GDSL hydrolase family protein n=1 Tax=Planctomicrobium sp. SH661 TaxID=3448124 RepID=UPI003F5B1036
MSKPSKNRPYLVFRLLVLTLLGIVLVGGVVFYIEFWYRRPVGSGPVGIAVEKETYESIWTEKPVMVLGLGDSITAGYGASAGMSYFDRVIKNPDGEFKEMQGISLRNVIPNLQSMNKSISGTTSLELLDFTLPRLEAAPEDHFGIVLLTTGGNDIIHNYGRTPPREGAMYGATISQAQEWIDAFGVRLNRILDEIEAKFPGGCDIFLANIYDPTDGIGDAEHAGLPAWPDGLKVIQAYNDLIEKTCASRENVHLVDIHSAFLGHGIHCRKFWRSGYRASDPYYWYFDNLEDPNDRGYDAIRRLFLTGIAKHAKPRLVQLAKS